MEGDFDVVIVGAGPAGSSAAILLARAGWSVALVEKLSFPRRKVCGECIAASNLPLLEALGIAAEFDAAAGPELRRFAFMRGEQQVMADLPSDSTQPYRWGRALGRETLDTLLLERARAEGATVLQPCSVLAIEGTIGRWRCHARIGGSRQAWVLRSPAIIAAHGSWERLPAERPAQSAARKASDLFAFKANFINADLAPGLLSVISFDGGYGGMVVADEGLTTVACCLRADRLADSRKQARGDTAGDTVEWMLKQQCLGVRDALAGASRQGAWIAAGPLAPGVRLRAGDDLFRVGNAAGEAHPIIGEGMSMALQSAWLLCSRLLRDEGRRGLHDVAWQRQAIRGYAADWRRAFSTRLALAAAFAQVSMRSSTAVPLIRIARQWPGLFTQGAVWSGKTRCAIDSSSIAQLTPRPRQPVGMPVTTSNAQA
ncbi:MAG: dependent oxidoreductase [Rhizobacter sp.]|nr:dependent oxidoreductase [Rhizobacter sp.]